MWFGSMVEKPIFLELFAWVLLCVMAISVKAKDPALLVHYGFDKVDGKTVLDDSGYGHSATIAGDIRYYEELKGRKGVLRLDGKTNRIDLPSSTALQTGGDLTFEVWARSNQASRKNNMVFSWGDHFSLLYVGRQFLANYSNDIDAMRTQLTDQDVFSEDWAHIAVVVESPRIRLYRNGELISDAYMPIQGIEAGEGLRVIGDRCAIDLDEVRIYRRALATDEIAAHARGEHIDAPREENLRIDAHWYEKTVTVCLSVKGADATGHVAELTLLRGDRTRVTAVKCVNLIESYEGSRRYIATAEYPLSVLEGESIDVVARIVGQQGEPIRTVVRHAFLKKPSWVDTPEGHLTQVPVPWTPVRVQVESDDDVIIDVWGRTHAFGRNMFPQQIEAVGVEILAESITLNGQIDGEDIQWRDESIELIEATDIAATLKQSANSDSVAIGMNTIMEFDGYAIYDCTVTAKRDTTLEELVLNIPIHSERATLCFGTDVYEKQTKPLVPMSVLHMGAVEGDLAFRFSPNVWLGDEEVGLTWQAESNEYWRYGDPQKAIEVLPRGGTTYLRANWINVPTPLTAGETLHYKFALQATPVKPMLRDSWDMRILRNDPYTGSSSELYTDSTGNNLDLNLPNRWIDIDHELEDRVYSTFVPDLYRMAPGPGRVPALEYYRDIGVHHLWINTHDNWPWPMPAHAGYGRQLHRLIDAVHANGLNVYGYQIHERMPTNIPEFDIHGTHMANRPIRPYEHATAFCAKSGAAQDAILHAMAGRLDQYGDDGIYLDGTGVHMKSCQNTEHGCGYHPRDGAISLDGSTVFDQSERGSDPRLTIYPTYPVFAERKLIQRLYVTLKQRRPHGIVDVHTWYLNTGGLAYADMLWTGEQWWHLRGKGAEYVIDELSLDTFRTMFMGYQIGVPAEVLPYRLLAKDTPCSRIAAISLLHDIPVRARVQNTEWLHIMSKLWQARDEFRASEAEKLFYWNNQDYVSVSPEQCFVTMLKHPINGVLAVVSNLNHEQTDVDVRFNLKSLGILSGDVVATNVLTGEEQPLESDGYYVISLGSHEWVYLWIK